MDNLKIYQICHDLIDYFATLTSPKKSYLGPIFRTGGSTIFFMVGNPAILYTYIYVCVSYMCVCNSFLGRTCVCVVLCVTAMSSPAWPGHPPFSLGIFAFLSLGREIIT